MSKYINPFTDAGFKRIFGQEEHKALLIAFLNRLFNGQMVITDVQYMDKEALGESSSGKSFIYDIYCTLDNGHHVIVEMQNKNEKDFLQRSLVYAARALDRQAIKSKGWQYRDLKAVISINFLNFEIAELPRQLLIDGTITDCHSQKQINSFLRLIYIQMPFMTKALEECDNNFERWIYLLKNIEQMEEIPEYLRSTMSEIQYFEDVMAQASLSAEESARYERSLEHYRREMSSIEYYRDEGRELGIELGLKEGRELGREEGREEGIKIGALQESLRKSLEIARKMKNDGLDFKSIALYTGLSETEIEEL